MAGIRNWSDNVLQTTLKPPFMKVAPGDRRECFFIRKTLTSVGINAVLVIKEVFRRQPCVAVSLDIEG